MARISGVVRHPRAGLILGMANGMVAQTPRYTLVLDGIIYNAAELGQADNDAEVLLDLVERYGFVAAIARLNADFSAALYDTSEDVLWLGRDRFGIVPLYYLRVDSVRAFGSQPRHVSIVSGAQLRVDPSFVARVAGNHYRGIDQDLATSPYQNVAQVPPATVIRLGADSEQRHRYWSLREEPDWTASAEELAQEYRALLLDAVRLRQRGTTQSAFTLSGGLDSSTVVASAAHITEQPQPAFSAVYDNPTFDESADIVPMLVSCVRPWERVRIGTPDVFGLVTTMVELHDEPVVTATWLAQYLVVQAAAQAGYTALWGGLGGDELNAGEYEYFMYYFADLKKNDRTDDLRREIAAWIGHHNHPLWRKSAEVVARELPRVVDLNQAGACKADTRRLGRYHAALNPDWAAYAHEQIPAEHPFSSYLKNRTYQDLTRETLPCCLRAEDRQTAAFGMSRRLPFLDHRVVEFMFRVPGELKIRRGITKYLLREAMRGILPEETRTRVKKTGWNAPAHQWFIGPGREQLLDLVNSQSFRQRGIYNVAAVEQLINEHAEIVTSGRTQENHMMFLWQLINVELWLASAERRGYTMLYVKEKTVPA